MMYESIRSHTTCPSNAVAPFFSHSLITQGNASKRGPEVLVKVPIYRSGRHHQHGIIALESHALSKQMCGESSTPKS